MKKTLEEMVTNMTNKEAIVFTALAVTGAFTLMGTGIFLGYKFKSSISKTVYERCLEYARKHNPREKRQQNEEA